MNEEARLPNGSNGRNEQKIAYLRGNGGRFAAGTRGGPGNPNVKQTAMIQQAFRDSITATDVQAIVAVLVRRAKNGDLVSAREILRRAGVRSITLSATPAAKPSVEPPSIRPPSAAQPSRDLGDRHPQSIHRLFRRNPAKGV